MSDYLNDLEAEFVRARKLIDEIDIKLLDLLAQRSRCVANIAKIKNNNDISIQDNQRENQILKNMLKKNTGLYHSDGIRKIFKTIFRAGINQQILYQAKKEKQ